MRIAWFGNRLWEAECLQPWLNVSFSITLEKSHSRIPGISLESVSGERRFWGSQNLFDPRLRKAVTVRGVDYDCLLSYAPRSYRSWLPKALWTVPFSLLQLWDDKCRTRRWFFANGLPAYPAVEISKGDWPSFSGLMVLQSPGGSCGSGTYIGKKDALQRIFNLSGWTRALITPFINGWVINGHVAVFNGGHLEVPWPSIQLVSVVHKDKCVQPLYAGNDFLAFYELIPSADQCYIRSLLYRLGELAAKKGYRGILGADLIYDPGNKTVGFLEVNARLQGSTGLLSKIEAGAGIVPVTVRTFLAMLGRKVSTVHYPERVPCTPEVPVSQYLVREKLQDKVSFDKNNSLRYGKCNGYFVQKLAVRERILTSRSIFSQTLCYQQSLPINMKNRVVPTKQCRFENTALHYLENT